jgi:hypothetical protein
VRSNASPEWTPWWRAGTFGLLRLQGEGSVVSEDGVQSWALGALTVSNDRAVLSQSDGLVNSLQVGRSTAQWLLMAGDVQPMFSALGTSLGLRGVLTQLAGPRSVLSATLGTVAHSWQGLAGDTEPPTYLRDAAALKLEHWTDERLSFFVTVQGFEDRKSSYRTDGPDAPPVQGQSISVGGRFADVLPSGVAREVVGEWAGSRARVASGPWQRSQAQALDGALQWREAGLRAGWHHTDAGFVSLSTQVVAGLREAYLAGDWRPLDLLGLSADLRSTRSTTGIADGDRVRAGERRSDSATVLASLSLGRWLPGVSLDGSHYQVDTTTPSIAGWAGGKSKQRFDRMNVNLAVAGWTAGLGAMRLDSQDRYAVDASSTTDGWSARLGRAFSRGDGDGLAWGDQAWINLLLSGQDQSPAGGPRNTLQQVQALGGWQLDGRWDLHFTLGQTQLEQDGGGLATRLRQAALDLRAALSRAASVTVFARIDRAESDTGSLSHRTSQAGVQFLVRY